MVDRSQHIFDEVALADDSGSVPGRGMVDRRELDLDRPSPATAREIEAGVDGEAVKPGIEPVRITKSGQVEPRSDQPILDRVACELGVPEDEAGRTVQPHDGGAGELGEGVVIAFPRSLDEPSLVHGRLGCHCDRMVALTAYGVSVA